MDGRTFARLLLLLFGCTLGSAQTLISSFTVNGQPSVQLNVGDPLELKCSSAGGVVSWTWRGQSSGRLLLGNGSMRSRILTIRRPASCADNEAVQCIADSNGIQDTKTVQIVVVGCPPING